MQIQGRDIEEIVEQLEVILKPGVAKKLKKGVVKTSGIVRNFDSPEYLTEYIFLHARLLCLKRRIITLVSQLRTDLYTVKKWQIKVWYC